MLYANFLADILSQDVVTYIIVGEAVLILLLAIFIISETISRSKKAKKKAKAMEANDLASSQKAKEDTDKLDEKIKKLEAKTANLETEVNNTKEELAKANEEREDLQDRVSYLEAQIECLKLQANNKEENEESTEEVVEDPVTLEETTDEVVEEVVEESTDEVVEEVVEETLVDDEVALEEAITEEEIVDETVEEATEESLADDEESTDEVVEEVEEVVNEETPLVEAADEDDDLEDAEDEDDDDSEESESEEMEATDETAVKKIKGKFNTKMMLVPDETKNYYSEVKNYLLKYRTKARFSARCESFRNKGLVAKVGLAGKSLKVYLAIDPATLENTKYHFRNVSEKKQYAEVPVMIKVKSDRGLKYFKELVDQMMSNRNVNVKKNYEEVDYTQQLIPNGEAILSSLGYPSTCMKNEVYSGAIPEELNDDLINYIPTKEKEVVEEEISEISIYLDTICEYFNDGDVVTQKVLKEKNILTRGNYLKVKARGVYNKKLTIYADEFEADALKMILCTNSTAIKLISNVEE